MKPLDKAAAMVFMGSGGLLTAWGLFSVLGTITGVAIGVTGIATGDEEMLIGIPIFLIYGVWMVICLVAGPVQIAAGVRLMKGHKGPLLWAAAFGGLLSTITVYCAMPGMVSFALGLASAVSTEDDSVDSIG